MRYYFCSIDTRRERSIYFGRMMTSSPHYVLGVADQAPPDGLESRVRRVAELVDEFYSR